MKFIFAGLTDQEVQQSRTQNGSNAVTPQDVESFWDKLLDNFKDPIIIILMLALVITVVLAIAGYAHWYEGMGIAIAVVLATLISTWSEYSNENAFQKLLEEASMIQVKVFRNEKLIQISIDELVVGDHILLQPGDTIPTDGIIVAGHVDANEASLTGESEPIKKQAMTSEEAITDDNRLFRAALIEDGEAVMKSTAVGDKTRYGQMMKEVLTAEDRLSPLQEKLTVLGKYIARFGYVGSVCIFAAFMSNHIFIQSVSVAAYFAQPSGEIIYHIVTALILAIIVIVMAVPEGLPMMIAMVLALNMKKLLAVKVLVRKLLGIETAGSLTILFSDKTGTLTQGQLVAEEFLTGNAQHFQELAAIPEPVADMLAFALRNNTSAVIDTSDPKNPKMVGADRTDQAMLRFVTARLGQKDAIQIVDTIAFSSARKFSATQVKGVKDLTLVKGAAEVIIDKCTQYLDVQGNRQPLTDKAILLGEMSKLSSRAMRVLAVAISETPIVEDKVLPTPLTLVGIFGMRDALRPTSYASVKTAKEAGIHVVMITGDARETAKAIATDVGLMEDKNAVIITSAELAEFSDEQVKASLPNLYVVARAFPTDKSRLVKLAKELGWVVGMTGDGVNDAPAVKNADVGFAMGSGTEMTKESSDIVVLDDNFSSITKAVLYGRTLFKSIRKFLIFQLTVSMSAILVAFFGPFFGFDLPLTMTQLLWINIIMDTFAALALAGEPALQRYLFEKPIPKDAPLITKDMWSSILVNGLSAATLSMLFLNVDSIHDLFARGLPTFIDETTMLACTPVLTDKTCIHNPAVEAVFLTAFFSFFAFMHTFNTLNARTESINLFEHIFENRLYFGIIALIIFLQIFLVYLGGEIMRTVPLQPMEWLYVLMFAVLLIPIDLTRKLLRNALFGNPVLTQSSK
ncbi:MAG: calcium-translocating P-type ATPase, PMCA-type [Beggiatoa sp. IS2]|nr:MAG: calcium-translocating P-type ATPase, PMCA-type [Beggiatoa sp. IS2]